MKLPIRFVCAALVMSCAGPLHAQAEPAAAAQAALPDWRGIWFLETAVPDINGFPNPETAASTGDVYPLLGLEQAPLTPAGASRMQEIVSTMGGRKADGWGYPMMMSGAAPLQFLITPEETLILNVYRDIRHVYTDGRSLPAEEDRWPTVWGESIGRWEGDTLVVETVAVEAPYKYFLLTPPFSSEARYTERIRKIGPDRIENQITIEDPETLSAPWTRTMVYQRTDGLDRLIHEPYTNDRSEVENGVFTIEPPQEP